MSTFVRALALGLVLAFAVPTSVDAQIQNPNTSTPTTLYFHIFDTFNKFVVNTQKMDTEFFEVGGTNFPSLVGTPLNTALGADYDFNTIYGTSTAGPVEYDFIENGRPRFHPERGIAADVQIDPAVQPIVYLYVDIRDLVGLGEAPEPEGVPNVLPEFTFRVTVRTGDDPGPDAQLDSGNLLMEGQQSAYLCGQDAIATGICAALATAFDVKTPDADGVIEFAIPMENVAGAIPQADAFNVRIDWYQRDPAGVIIQEDQFAEGYMRLFASPEKQPRLEFNVMNPVYISFIHPQVAAGTLLIHTGVNSPWGTYDVDPANITMTVQGPAQPQTLQQVVAQNQHVHGLHHLDAEITYLWKFRDENAPNGEYTITMQVPNLAGNAIATGTAGFKIEGKRAFGIADTGVEVPNTAADESSDSPAVGFLAVLALAGAAIAIRRR
jgi:MYXO-CTERM domain-containing protein